MRIILDKVQGRILSLDILLGVALGPMYISPKKSQSIYFDNIFKFNCVPRYRHPCHLIPSQVSGIVPGDVSSQFTKSPSTKHNYLRTTF